MERPLLITSDIHGNEEGVRLLKSAISKFNVDLILSAGDQCPDPYDPFYQSLLSVRGNCDRFYNYGTLPFPPLFRELELFGRKIYITHGDVYSYEDFPMKDGDIFISGHTHVPLMIKKKGFYILNPGSPSRPRSSEGPTAILLSSQCARLISLLDLAQISALSFSSL